VMVLIKISLRVRTLAMFLRMIISGLLMEDCEEGSENESGLIGVMDWEERYLNGRRSLQWLDPYAKPIFVY
jgi:hypothetical protein